MTTINVSFNPLETWKVEDFRNFIEDIQETDNINLYIIAFDENSDFTTYINSVGTKIGLDSSRILPESTISGVMTEIEDNNIHIHIDANNEVLTELNSNTTDNCQTVLFRYATNGTPILTYRTEFNRILKDLIDG